MPSVGYPDCANHAAMGKKGLLAAIAESPSRPEVRQRFFPVKIDYFVSRVNHLLTRPQLANDVGGFHESFGTFRPLGSP